MPEPLASGRLRSGGRRICLRYREEAYGQEMPVEPAPADLDEPPLRLLPGASAYRTGRLVSQQRLADDQKRRHLSEAADFPGQLDTRGGDIALQK
jgi:hypothetical protein